VSTVVLSLLASVRIPRANRINGWPVPKQLGMPSVQRCGSRLRLPRLWGGCHWLVPTLQGGNAVAAVSAAKTPHGIGFHDVEQLDLLPRWSVGARVKHDAGR